MSALPRQVWPDWYMEYLEREAQKAREADEWTPSFSSWRHGGWYVNNVRYPSGAVGCVSNNYEDHKWRIVCGDYDKTYPSRDAAARAERLIAEGQK